MSGCKVQSANPFFLQTACFHLFVSRAFLTSCGEVQPGTITVTTDFDGVGDTGHRYARSPKVAQLAGASAFDCNHDVEESDRIALAFILEADQSK